jgi:hypothetical protein
MALERIGSKGSEQQKSCKSSQLVNQSLPFFLHGRQKPMKKTEKKEVWKKEGIVPVKKLVYIGKWQETQSM